MIDKVILDLCGGTGRWSDPYKKAGYTVVNVTLPKWDILEYQPPAHVHGILAAPPCTHFSGSGAQYWAIKDADGRTEEALLMVEACLDIILYCKPDWWCLENPVGRLPNLLPDKLGKPRMYIQPHEYGDPYTKKTCLWGTFTPPVKNPVEPIKVCKQGSWLQQLGGSSERTKYLRSLTPLGFAQAFFEANP